MPRTWACPFWKWEEGLKVHCAGGRMDFTDRAGREDYISRYCANSSGWKDCTVADNLCRGYERGIATGDTE